MAKTANTENDTMNLIEELSTKSEPVKVLKPFRASVMWFAVSIVIMIIVSGALGWRSDLFSKLDDPMFMVEILLALATGLFAALAAHWLAVPDAKQQRWVFWLPFVPLTLLSFMVIYQMLLQPMEIVINPNHVHCITDVVMIISLPTIALFMMIRKAATTRAKFTSFMALIAVLAFGYLCSRLICPMDNMEHLLVWNYAPSVLIAVVGAFIGSRLLRW